MFAHSVIHGSEPMIGKYIRRFQDQHRMSAEPGPRALNKENDLDFFLIW